MEVFCAFHRGEFCPVSLTRKRTAFSLPPSLAMAIHKATRTEISVTKWVPESCGRPFFREELPWICRHFACSFAHFSTRAAMRGQGTTTECPLAEQHVVQMATNRQLPHRPWTEAATQTHAHSFIFARANHAHGCITHAVQRRKKTFFLGMHRGLRGRSAKPGTSPFPLYETLGMIRNTCVAYPSGGLPIFPSPPFCGARVFFGISVSLCRRGQIEPPAVARYAPGDRLREDMRPVQGIGLRDSM